MKGVQALHQSRIKGDDGIERGIIHRDLKPENIMLSLDNTIKIIDFTTSAFAAKDSFRNTFSGTPGFIVWYISFDYKINIWIRFDDILNEVTNDVDKNNTEYMKETKKVVKQEAQIDFDDFKNDLNELDNGEKNEKSKEIISIVI